MATTKSKRKRCKEYRVFWSIELAADSPREAAKEALRIQRDPDSLATFFTVRTLCGRIVADRDYDLGKKR
jgi:hypothetical protein